MGRKPGGYTSTRVVFSSRSTISCAYWQPSPRIYHETVAFSLRSGRRGIEVRIAPPEDAELELAGFGPHLLLGALDTAQYKVPARANKLRGWRIDFMVLAFLLYAAFVLYIIYQMITQGPASFA